MGVLDGLAESDAPYSAWARSRLSVYVAPEHRRRGLARRLAREAVLWARRHEYPAVSLHASAAGRRIYERLGFEATTEMRLDLRRSGPSARRASDVGAGRIRYG